MSQNIKKYIISFIAFLLSMGLYLSAQAYILPGSYILKYMIQNLGKAKSLEVVQEVIVYDSGSLDGGMEGTETVRYIFSDAYRSDTKSGKGERIHVASTDEELTIVEGSISSPSSNWTDASKEILFFRSLKSLEQRLLFRRVSISVSSYGRFQGKAVYVLGAKYPDETKPQIWLMKDTFLPLRWIVRTPHERGSGDKLEIRYLGWRQTDENWYPMRIEFYKNDVLVREVNVKNVSFDASFPKELFNIGRLRSMHR